MYGILHCIVLAYNINDPYPKVASTEELDRAPLLLGKTKSEETDSMSKSGKNDSVKTIEMVAWIGEKLNERQATQLYDTLKWPILVYVLLACAYVFKLKGNVWFTWHPIAMFASFVLMAGNAALIKKIGGKENTKIHGFTMIAATAVAGFGWYVIHSNKDMFKKAHLLTTHGQLGAAVVVCYIAIGIFGAFALNPDWGFLRTNNTVRLAHKIGGRVLTALSWLSCVLGYRTMDQSPESSSLIILPLLVFGLFVLL